MKESGDDTERSPASPDCFARPVAQGAKKASRAGEGTHPTIRPSQCRAAPLADGQNRKELPVRKSGRRAVSQGSVRGPPASGDLELYVRSLGGESTSGM